MLTWIEGTIDSRSDDEMIFQVLNSVVMSSVESTLEHKKRGGHVVAAVSYHRTIVFPCKNLLSKCHLGGERRGVGEFESNTSGTIVNILEIFG